MLDYSKAIYPEPPFVASNCERVFLHLPTEKMSNFMAFELLMHKQDLDARGYVYGEPTFSSWEEHPEHCVPFKVVGYKIDVRGFKEPRQ